MKIGIGKLGKSILFNDKNWGAIGGDNEAPILFENIILVILCYNDCILCIEKTI